MPTRPKESDFHTTSVDPLNYPEQKPQVVDKGRFASMDADDLPSFEDYVAGNAEVPIEGTMSLNLPTKPQEAVNRVNRLRFGRIGDLTSEDVPTYQPEGPQPSDTPQFSPSSDPNKPTLMDFSSAIKQVLEGKRVTRLEWGNPEIYLLMFMWGNISPQQPAGKYLSIHHADGSVNPLIINDGDMLGDDWVVVA